MRIFAIGIVKDERDVIGYTLEAALEWADAIHIVDNGSTDGTLDVLAGMRSDHPHRISFHQTTAPYTNALRTEAVDHLYAGAAAGDWWGLLDADEIYLDSPRTFLSGVSSACGIVQSASIQFYLTEHDLNAGVLTQTWSPEDSRYCLMNWSEARFVRHQTGVPWTDKWPDNTDQLTVCPDRIRLLHYQFRTPAQTQRRVLTRRRTTDGFRHEKREVWTQRGISPSDIMFTGIDLPEDEMWKARVVRSDALLRYDPAAPPEDTRHLPQLPGRPSLTPARIVQGVRSRLRRLFK